MNEKVAASSVLHKAEGRGLSLSFHMTHISEKQGRGLKCVACVLLGCVMSCTSCTFAQGLVIVHVCVCVCLAALGVHPSAFGSPACQVTAARATICAREGVTG